MNNVAINIHEQFFLVVVSFDSYVNPKECSTGAYGKSMFRLVRNC